jgi:hypothetical protein
VNRLAVAAAALSAMLHAPAASAQTAKFLPLTRTEIIALTAGSTNRESLGVKTADAIKARPAESFAPGDELTLANNPKIPLTVFLAGKGENIHSIRIVAPVVNYSNEQSERVFKILSSLFTKIYPSWPDAAQWPQDSLSKSWNISPLVTKKMPADADDQIIRKEIDGVTSATFGVPPDIVVYSITSRPQCIPTVKSGNPFQRAVC